MLRPVALVLGGMLCMAVAARSDGAEKAKSPLDFKLKDIDGKDVELARYKGKVVLIVNVASFCGNTPQYAGLEKLYQKYKQQGLVVLGIPANEFGRQEPGTNAEIKEFCSTKYHVTFDMFAKIVVKGDHIDPLYAWLTGSETNPDFAGEIGWNFEKFLVGRNGQVVKRFAPKVKPEADEVVRTVEAELAKK